MTDLVLRTWPAALDSLEEELHDAGGIGDKISASPKLKRDFFERVCFFIDRDMERVADSAGASRRATPLERAQARLYVWQQLYT